MRTEPGAAYDEYARRVSVREALEEAASLDLVNVIIIGRVSSGKRWVKVSAQPNDA